MPPHTPFIQAVSRHPILVAVGVCGVVQVVFPGAISRLLPEKFRSAFYDIPFPEKLRPLGMALVDFAPRLRSIFKIKGEKEELVVDEDTRGTVPIDEEEKAEPEGESEAPALKEQVEEGGGVPIDGGEGHHEHHEHHG